jgi:hypothetical protein
MCDWIAKEKAETLQVVDCRCGTSDDLLLDCHCVGLVVQICDTVGFVILNDADLMTRDIFCCYCTKGVFGGQDLGRRCGVCSRLCRLIDSSRYLLPLVVRQLLLRGHATSHSHPQSSISDIYGLPQYIPTMEPEVTRSRKMTLP